MKDIISIETGINTMFPKDCYPITGTIELFNADISISGEFIVHRSKNMIYLQINPFNILNLYWGDLISSNFFNNINYILYPDSKIVKCLDSSICVDGLTNITISGTGYIPGDFTIYLDQNDTKTIGELIPLFDHDHEFSITIQ